MKKILLISPHFDDAVLSAGQLLAGRTDADVVTVFAGEPAKIQSTPYDIKCGFKNSKEAVVNRRIEDDEALALLGATPIHWDFPDGQYGEQVSVKKIEFAILNQVEKEDYEFILAPLGLGHPDHVLLADIVFKISHHINIPIYMWEDLPLRVVEPETVIPRLEKFGIKKRESIGDGAIAKKIRSLSCYRSQIGTGILDPYLMYVPERFWKL